MDLSWTKTPAAWIAFNPEVDLDNLETIQDRPNEKIQKFCKDLLEIGGHRVSVWFADEELIPYILDVGEIVKYQKFRLEKGEERECHANSTSMWRKNPGKYQIMTGYALSEDGIWRRHTWLLADEELIETTIKRENYFGCKLEEDIAEAFAISYLD